MLHVLRDVLQTQEDNLAEKAVSKNGIATLRLYSIVGAFLGKFISNLVSFITQHEQSSWSPMYNQVITINRQIAIG